MTKVLKSLADTVGGGKPSDANQHFHFDVPVVAFEKADEPEGQRKRIAGIISTEGLDQQNEKLLQDGLDFDPFLRTGFFNDEHSKAVCDVVGYPKEVKRYAQGEVLPNGQVAKSNLTWTEGFLCGRKGQDIWQLAQDLEGTGRTLGFSVEGEIEARKSDARNVITSAQVTGVAVCRRPVNADCRLMPLLRSMDAAQKAYTVGSPGVDAAIPRPTPNVPITGEGTGQAMLAQLGMMVRRRRKKASRKLRKQTPRIPSKVSKAQVGAAPQISLTRQDALAWLHKAVPDVSEATAEAFYRTALAMVAQGLL